MQAVKAARYVWQYGGTAVTYYHLSDCDYRKIIYQRCDEKCRKSGSRMVHAAKQDYDLYREHSADRQRRKPDEELSEEEYLARRREEKLKKDTGKRRKSTGAHE